MGNATSKDRSPTGAKKRDSLTRSIFFGTSIVSEAIPIDTGKSVTLSEVHGSSVHSPCVDVSFPYLNDAETLDSISELQTPNTQKTFEFDEDKADSDKNEIDLAERNLMQIFHAESPEQSLLSAWESCDLHRAPSVGVPDIDDCGDPSSDEDSDENGHSKPKNTSYSSLSQTRVNAMAEQQMSERDERSDVISKEKPATALQPNDKPSDIDIPYEIYTMNFGGLYTFSATTLDNITETEQQLSQTGEKLSEKGESSEEGDLDLALPNMQDKKDVSTPYEMFTVSFGGLHTFTTTSSVSDGDVVVQSDVSKMNNEEDCRQMTADQVACTPYEVHTMTFGGLYTFAATAPPVQCDDAPPLRAA